MVVFDFWWLMCSSTGLSPEIVHCAKAQSGWQFLVYPVVGGHCAHSLKHSSFLPPVPRGLDFMQPQSFKKKNLFTNLFDVLCGIFSSSAPFLNWTLVYVYMFCCTTEPWWGFFCFHHTFSLSTSLNNQPLCDILFSVWCSVHRLTDCVTCHQVTALVMMICCLVL